MAETFAARGGRILVERSIGETRAVAMDASETAFALYVERASDTGRRARWGDVFEARVRAVSPQQGAVFVELEGGIEAVLRPDARAPVTEGEALTVRVVAEAHRGKLARVERHNGVAGDQSGLERWQACLPGGEHLLIESVEVGDDDVAEAFEAAIDPIVVLPGGGRITLTPTPALLAVDIDTAGRKDSGRAANRALSVNRLAASALALELSLRRIGGLVVMDCVAPMNRDAGEKVRSVFTLAHKALSARHVKCLRPSPLGLMEMSVERQYAPIGDIMVGADEHLTPETICLNALRRLAVEARANPMAKLTLGLPTLAKAWFDSCGLNLQESIDQTFGARISVNEISHRQFEISIQ